MLKERFCIDVANTRGDLYITLEDWNSIQVIVKHAIIKESLKKGNQLQIGSDMKVFFPLMTSRW
jgi:hypothetical protein